MKKRIGLTLVSVIFSLHVGFAGWVVTQVSYDSDEGKDHGKTEKIYLQDNRMKIVQEGMQVVFDNNTGLFMLISTAKKTYWQGSLKDYHDQLSELFMKTLEVQLERVPEEKREATRTMYKNMLEQMIDPGKGFEQNLQQMSLNIKETGETEPIANVPNILYSIHVNGVKKQELWLPKKNKVADEFDMETYQKKFTGFTQQGISEENAWMLKPEYQQVLKEGFPMKTVTFKSGYESIVEVLDIEKEEMDEAFFKAPEGFTKGTLEELGLDE